MTTASDGGDGIVGRWDTGSRQERTGSAPDLSVTTCGTRARSVSLASSLDGTEDGGVRLSTLTLEDSPKSLGCLPRHSEANSRTETGGLGDFTRCIEIAGLGNITRRPSIAARGDLAGRGIHGNQSTFGTVAAETEPRHDEKVPRFQLGKKPSGDVFLSSSGQSPVAHDNNRTTVTHRDVGVHGYSDDSPGSPSTAHVLRNRSSNISGRHQVGGVDAQGIYPPTACVFVANLPEPKDDRALEAAVTREFSKYGTVFVKIRRDPHNMPFAFCQFMRNEDAKAAMEQGKGAMVCGRPCRTEMVKANRAFFIYRRRGVPITLEEARSVLEQFGALERVEFSARLQSELQVEAVIVVEFTTFDPTRDLQSAFRHSDIYCVGAVDSRRGALPRRDDADEVFLNQYEIDRRSIFVGNLPIEVDEDAVTELFSSVGTIKKVQLIRRITHFGTRAFAFVEFDRPDTPETAVSRFHDRHFGGSQIRVERKVGRDQTPRRVRSMHLPQNTSPDKAPDKLTPSTPRTSVTRSTECGPSDGQSTPGLAHSIAPAWNWMYPSHSPTQVTFNNQGFVGGSATPYGPQLGHPTGPVTPQTPESFSPYHAAYYSPIWPGVPFVQNAVSGAMPSFYTTYGTPTVAGISEQQTADDDLATPTRANRATTVRDYRDPPDGDDFNAAQA